MVVPVPPRALEERVPGVLLLVPRKLLLLPVPVPVLPRKPLLLLLLPTLLPLEGALAAPCRALDAKSRRTGAHLQAIRDRPR